MASVNPLIQQTFGIARGLVRGWVRLGRGTASFAIGKTSGLLSSSRKSKPHMDDVTLARKVETELFRGADASKGQINVNVVDGVVELRGEVKRPQEVKTLEAKARAIPEVRDVRNLLHLQKTPSPTRTDSPGDHRKRAQTRRAGQANRAQTAERKPRGAENTPKEKATKGEGRTPAPFGGDAS